MTTDKVSKSKLETLRHTLERSSPTECCRGSEPHSVRPLLLAQVERDSEPGLWAMLLSLDKPSALERHSSSSSSKHWRGKDPAVDVLRLVDLLLDVTELGSNQHVSHSGAQERIGHKRQHRCCSLSAINANIAAASFTPLPGRGEEEAKS